ncbi:hypothetical protein BH09ACT4_BH09ACT4_24020 [soil metagenome]
MLHLWLFFVTPLTLAECLVRPDALVLYCAERRGAELVTTDPILAGATQEHGIGATLLTA